MAKGAHYRHHASRPSGPNSGHLETTLVRYLYIFRGIINSPHFDFNKIFFRKKLRWAAPDVEVLDINQDNLPDINVIQEMRERANTLEQAMLIIFGKADRRGMHLLSFCLLVVRLLDKNSYRKVLLKHSMPGCGLIAQRWGDETMLLGQGSHDAPGYSLLLEWHVLRPRNDSYNKLYQYL
jgi:hypothetical protein